MALSLRKAVSFLGNDPILSGDWTVTGDLTVDGDLNVTAGTTTMKYGVVNQYLAYSPLNSVPSSTGVGYVYMDNGNNSATGDPCLRFYDGNVWGDLPMYQQGTWTPVMGNGTLDFNLTTAQGVWYRHGNWVNSFAYVAWNATIASGSIVLENVSPYSMDTSDISYTVGTVTGTGLLPAAGQIMTCRKTSGANLNFVLTTTPDVGGGAPTALANAQAANFDTSGSAYVHIHYPTTGDPA